VVRDGDRAVRCGAIRLLDPTTAGVKRMYVDPDHRGNGVGWAVLASLEAAARQLGVQRLVLETGVHQDAAISLSPRRLHADRLLGEYATSPTSLCFEKYLELGSR
jgi:GNAT superfamily N-acetyltransferase